MSGKGKNTVGEAEGELLEMVLTINAPQDQQQQGRRRISARFAEKLQATNASAVVKRK